MGRQGLGNGWLVEAVVRQRGAHLLQSLAQFCRSKAGPGGQMAGALQLRIYGCALGALHGDDADEGARRPAKNQVHAIGLTRTLHLDAVKKAGRKQLPQALFQVVSAQSRALGLGQMAGQGRQPGG